VLQWLRRILSGWEASRSDDAVPPYTDIWRSRVRPSTTELLESYRNIAYACANLNAKGVAGTTVRLYTTTQRGERSPRFAHRELDTHEMRELRDVHSLSPRIGKSIKIDEITEHPILDLLYTVNKYHCQYDLFELTSVYLDIIGVAFWRLERNALGIPQRIWILPPQNIRVITDNDGVSTTITGFKYTVRGQSVVYAANEVIFFRALNIMDPYFAGYSALFAAMENFRMLERDVSLAAAMMENRGRPDLIISPKDPGDVIGAPQIKRMEKLFSRMFGRFNSGRPFFSRTPLQVDKTAFTSRDMEGVPRNQVSKVSVANSFDVPIALLEAKEINRATLEAAMVQHARYAILPRVTRIMERLNKDLTPLYDTRLFLWFDNPIPEDEERRANIREKNIKVGLRTINEERERIEEPPVEWGDQPWAWGKVGLLDRQFIETSNARGRPNATGQDTNVSSGNEPGKALYEVLLTYIAFYSGYLTQPEAAALLMKLVNTSVWDIFKSLQPFKCQYAKFYGETYHHSDTYMTRGHARKLPASDMFEKELQRFFRAQRDLTLGGLKNLDWSVKVTLPDGFDMESFTEELTRLSVPQLSLYYETGIREFIARVNAGSLSEIPFRVDPKNARNEVNQLALQIARDMNATTSRELNTGLNDLRDRLARGLISSENTPSELTRMIAEIFDRAERYRAHQIGTSESSRAMHAAQLMIAKKTDFVIKKTWLLSGNPCQVCVDIKKATGDGILLDQAFVAANDVQHPPSHSSCQCTMIEEIDWDVVNKRTEQSEPIEVSI